MSTVGSKFSTCLWHSNTQYSASGLQFSALLLRKSQKFSQNPNKEKKIFLKNGDSMNYDPHVERIFQDTVEAHFKLMGYNTRPHTALHTRPTHIRAEMHTHPKGPQKILIACTHNQSLDLPQVQKFCSKVAFARETHQADSGLLISNKEFSPEAITWCEKHCSFVKLKTFKELILTSAKCRKLLKKFPTEEIS